MSHKPPAGRRSRTISPRTTPCLFPFVCVACRKSFKRALPAAEPYERPCPACEQPAVALSRKFRVPPRDDDEQWRKVALLVAHGFRFERVYEPVPGEPRTLRQVEYPERLRDTRAWLKRYGHLAPRSTGR